MNVSEILRQSWILIRDNPRLFLFGLAAAAALEPFLIFISTSTSSFLPSLSAASDPATLPQVFAGLEENLGPILIALLLIFILLLLSWLVGTVVEAGLIFTVGRALQGDNLDLAAGWGAGLRALLPLIALDTIVYFPPFFIVLLMILIVGGSLIGAGLAVSGSLGIGANPLPFLLPLVCLFPLVLILVICGPLVSIWRAVAFRERLLLNQHLRPSLRAPVRYFRRSPSRFALFILPPLVLGWLGGLITNQAATIFGLTSAWLPFWFVTTMQAFSRVILRGVLLVFTSTIWTAGFLRLGQASRAPDLP